MQVLNINEETGEIEFEITKEEEELLNNLCKEHNMNIEELISKILEDYINKEEKEEKV